MTKNILQLQDKKVWDYICGNSYVSVKNKLVYIATPKVACTSLKWWFAELEGYSKIISKMTDSLESAPDMIIHDCFYKVAPNVTGLTPEMLIEPLVSDNYFRFAVVRNPYKRIFSAWQSKLLLREPLQAGPYHDYDFLLAPIENATDIAVAFEGFLEHLATCEAPNYWDYHWTPQVSLIRPDLIKYTKLAQIENVKELSLALAEHLGQHIPDPFAYRRANESIIPFMPDFVTDRAAELIRLLYAGDFSTFGYDTRIPETRKEFTNSELDIALKAIRLIRDRHQRITEIRTNYSKQITSLNRAVAERDLHISEQERELTAYQIQAEEYSHQVKKLQNELEFRDSHIKHQNEELSTYQVQAEEYSRKLETLREQRVLELQNVQFLTKQLIDLYIQKFTKVFRGGV